MTTFEPIIPSYDDDDHDDVIEIRPSALQEDPEELGGEPPRKLMGSKPVQLEIEGSQRVYSIDQTDALLDTYVDQDVYLHFWLSPQPQNASRAQPIPRALELQLRGDSGVGRFQRFLLSEAVQSVHVPAGHLARVDYRPRQANTQDKYVVASVDVGLTVNAALGLTPYEDSLHDITALNLPSTVATEVTTPLPQSVTRVRLNAPESFYGVRVWLSGGQQQFSTDPAQRSALTFSDDGHWFDARAFTSITVHRFATTIVPGDFPALAIETRV